MGVTGREEFTIATKRTKASIYRDLAEERENEVVYEPRRGQTLLSGCLASVRYVVMLFAVSIMLSALLLSFANDLFAFVKDEDKQINLTVSASDDVDDIAKKLKDGGIIQYRFLFRLFMRITENDEEIVPGDYEIKATMDYRAISKAIGPKVKPRESIDVVIPEGYSQEEIFLLLEEKGVCAASDLRDAAKNYEFKYSWLEGFPNDEKRLEGFLFPDTYTFYIDDNAPRVLGKFLANFNRKYDVDFKTRVEELETNLYDIVTIAAMIEKEAKYDEDRPYISSVIYNRLASKNFPYLQIDATVLYAIGEHKDVISSADLAFDSPYNTYVTKGLPKGPICNPGQESLAAALYPEETGYYFYVAKPDGTHIFTKTISQHNKAIAEAKKLWAEVEAETQD